MGQLSSMHLLHTSSQPSDPALKLHEHDPVFVFWLLSNHFHQDKEFWVKKSLEYYIRNYLIDEIVVLQSGGRNVCTNIVL